MELERSIVDFIGNELLPGTPADKIQTSGSLFDDGIIDSLGLQQLIVYLETEFDIIVEEDHLVPENFETVSGMSSLVQTLSSS